MQTRTAAEQMRYTRLHQQFGPSKGEDTAMDIAIATNPTSLSRARTALSVGLTGLVLSVAAVGAAGAFTGGNEVARPVEAAPSRSTINVPVQPGYSPPAMTYFLVASEEQRQAVFLEQQEAAADWLAYRNMAYRFEILVAGTATEEADAVSFLERTKARWAATGATGLEVVDRRTGAGDLSQRYAPSTRGTTAEDDEAIIAYGGAGALNVAGMSGPNSVTPPVASGQSKMFIYLVSSQAQADKIWEVQDEAAWAEANGARATSYSFDVLVQADAESFGRGLQSYQQRNQVRLQNGLPPVVFIDFRGR